jgi:hypothetical protein
VNSDRPAAAALARAALIAMASLLVTNDASHAARWVACHGVRSQPVPVALVGGWTKSQDAYQAMLALQRAGVPADVCQTAEDRCDHDPQLAALKWLTEVTGTKIGRWPRCPSR